jgi:hypothetical protein
MKSLQVTRVVLSLEVSHFSKSLSSPIVLRSAECGSWSFYRCVCAPSSLTLAMTFLVILFLLQLCIIFIPQEAVVANCEWGRGWPDFGVGWDVVKWLVICQKFTNSWICRRKWLFHLALRKSWWRHLTYPNQFLMIGWSLETNVKHLNILKKIDGRATIMIA